MAHTLTVDQIVQLASRLSSLEQQEIIERPTSDLLPSLPLTPSSITSQAQATDDTNPDGSLGKAQEMEVSLADLLKPIIMEARSKLRKPRLAPMDSLKREFDAAMVEKYRKQGIYV